MFSTRGILTSVFFAVALMLLPESLFARGHHGGGHHGSWSGSHYSGCSGVGHCTTHSKGHCGKHHRVTRSCRSSYGSSCGGVGRCTTHGKGHCGKHHRVTRSCRSSYGSSCGGKGHCGKHGKGHCGKHHRTGRWCTPTKPPVKVTGDVEGVVFMDENNNGTFENGEGIEDVRVILYDSNGNTHTDYTDSDGNYYFDNIPKGDATVKIDESTLPDNSGQSVGENPSDLYVEADEENHAGYDGYENVTTPSTGDVTGEVFIDKNANGTIQDGEGAQGVRVILYDSNGNRHTTRTDSYGSYYFSDIPSGDATVKIDESTLPDNSGQITGDNPSGVYVESNEVNHAGYDGYASPSSDDGVGNVIGVVFIDKNGNGTIQDGEGVAYVKVKLTDKNGNEMITQTDKYGEYYFYDVPSGDSTVEVLESTLPMNAQQTVGENPSSVYITPNEENHAGYDGYVCD